MRDHRQAYHSQQMHFASRKARKLVVKYTLSAYCVTDVFMKYTNSSTIEDKPRCRVGHFWPKVEHDIRYSADSI